MFSNFFLHHSLFKEGTNLHCLSDISIQYKSSIFPHRAQKTTSCFMNPMDCSNLVFEYIHAHTHVFITIDVFCITLLSWRVCIVNKPQDEVSRLGPPFTRRNFYIYVYICIILIMFSWLYWLCSLEHFMNHSLWCGPFQLAAELMEFTWFRYESQWKPITRHKRRRLEFKHQSCKHSLSCVDNIAKAQQVVF